VAWRVAEAPPDLAGVLVDLLGRLLHHSPPQPESDQVTGLKGIAEAGEALRTGRAREARLFSAVEG
jgi:hypothetical protein